jgi:hypothetical protein
MKKINRRSDDNGPRQNRTPFTAGRDNRQKMKSYSIDVLSVILKIITEKTAHMPRCSKNTYP